MQTKEYLQSVVDYIEENLHQNLSVDQLASHVGFSKFYLNRLFSTYSGFSLMEYVRKRKLYAAMNDLKSSQRIIDIAIKYQYSSERSFSRAFVSEFGHSPSYYRKNPSIWSTKLIISDLSLDLSEGGEEMLEFLSKVRYETIKTMTVISGTIESLNPEEEIIGLMTELAATINIQPIRTFGFDSPVSEDLSAKGYRGYEFWLSLKDEDITKTTTYGLSVNHNFESTLTFTYKNTLIKVKEIPSYRYASLRITDPFENPFERIPIGWKSLVKWLEDNDFNKDHFEPTACMECLEEIIEVDGITYMDIFIPIDRG
jgi:AraC family transcriptional regulator